MVESITAEVLVDREPTEALREHWPEIFVHRDALRERLGSPVDLRVALVSYLVEVDPDLELKLVDRPRRNRRFDIRWDGKFRRVGEEIHPLIALNVSADGMLVLTGERLGVGSLIEVKIPLPPRGPEIEMVGRVTRVRGLGGGKFEAAIGFIHISSEDRRALLQRAGRPDRI